MKSQVLNPYKEEEVGLCISDIRGWHIVQPGPLT